MVAESKPDAAEGNDLELAPCTLRIPCPGSAHRAGEVCLICDEDSDGTITVVVTEVEIAALGRAADGCPVDTSLLPRLRSLGLVHEVAGKTAPTDEGYALFSSRVMRPN